MNDTSNSLPPSGDDALEARIVAWVLGEASSFEAAELEKLCAENPRLRDFERRTRDLHELLAEDAKPGLHAEWRLPRAKREKITDLLGVPAGPLPAYSSAKVNRYFTRRILLAAAACLAISLISYPLFNSGKVSKVSYAMAPEKSVDFTAFSSPAPDNKAAERELEDLRRAVAEQEDQVEDSRKFLSSIIRTGKVLYEPGASRAGGFSTADETEVARNYTKLEQEKIQLESQIETLLKYDGPQLANYASSLDLPDNIIPSLLPQYQQARREYEGMKSQGLAEGHPSMASQAKVLAGMEQDLSEASADLREALKSKLELSKGELAKLESRMNLNKEDAVKSGLETQSYLDAKSDFESNRRVMEQLKLELITKEMNAKLGEAGLALNDSAKPAAAPAPAVIPESGALPSLAQLDEAGGISGGLGGRSSGMGRGFAEGATSEPAKEGTKLYGMIESKKDAETTLAEANQPAADAFAAAGTNVTDIVTGGLRSGDDAINRNNIDAILDNPSRSLSTKDQATAPADPFGGAAGAKMPESLAKKEASAPDSFFGQPELDLQQATGTSLGFPALPGQMLQDHDGFLNYGTPLAPARPAITANGIATPDFGDLKKLGELAQSTPQQGFLHGPEAPADQTTVGGEIFYSRGASAQPAAGLSLDSLAALSGGTNERFTTADPSRFAYSLTPPNVPTIETTREFTYPKEFDPPQVPNSMGDSLAQIVPAPITPATPTTFPTEEVRYKIDGPATATAAKADGSGYSTEAQKQMIRRQDSVAQADRLLLEGRDAYAKGKYEEARAKYKEADGVLPDAPMVADRRKVLQDQLADASTALADSYRRVGKYDEARSLAADVQAHDANNVDAKRINEWLDDPIKTNPAVTDEHAENVDKVGRDLYLAEGAYSLGKYDDAFKHYEEAIKTDRFNKAARRGMERVTQAKSDYYRAAYDHTRAELLAQVDTAWELQVPPVIAGKPVAAAPSVDTKSRAIRIPELKLEEASVGEVLDVLRQKSAEFDNSTSDPAKKGVALVVEDSSANADRIDLQSIRVPKLDLENVTVEEALAQITAATGLEQEAGEHAILLKSGPLTKGKQTEQILDKMAEVATGSEPFSTFSLHVSDASFKLAKAALDRGEQPAAESIRPEEFYNAFDYGDPAPANGEPVVCTTEQAAHPAIPQRNLLRIGVRTAAAGRGQSTPLNLTLLLDSSGSMEREDRQTAMTRAVAQLSGLLKEGDTITVAGFARQPRLIADRLPGARAKELNGIIAQTPSEGGTNLEEGIKLAEELAKRQFNPAAQNRIVLFTDGAANLGDARPEALRQRVEQLRQQNIAFDAAGFGAAGLNDRLLEQLTRNGNGRYYIVDRAEDAGTNFAKQLAGAFRPAAENVKVQVRFNPARVARYKLLGFEEHRLNKEDFRNDAVDAAEMAAEEAGNALYQIEPIPGGEGEVGEVSVRFRDAASGQMVERTWTIPYDAQAPAFDRATPSVQLAGLAAFASEKLRKSPLADALDFNQLGKSFAAVKAKYPDSQPVTDLGTMIDKLK